jgi:hypothetical protein
MTEAAPNSRGEIARRKTIGLLTWPGPALMLCGRSIFSLLAQGLVAGVYALRSSPGRPQRAGFPSMPRSSTWDPLGCSGR